MSVATAAQSASLDEVLDDLCMRFLNNLPPSEYESFERLFFAVEAAHWFYDDFHREENRALPRLTLEAFAAKIFGHSPLLQPHAADVNALTSQFKTYKHEVPTCGAAMLTPDMSKVLLVCGWGKGGKWGFPKGKIGKDETELEAAVREVFEETGFDFSTVLPPDPEDDSLAEEPFFIDSLQGGKLSRIFVVPDVPEDTVFETRTRKEISAIKWVPISALPDPRSKQSGSGGSGDGSGGSGAGGGGDGGDGRAAAEGTATGCANGADANSPGQSRQPGENQQLRSKQFWLVSQYVPKLKSFIKRRRKRITSGGIGVIGSNGFASAVEGVASEKRDAAVDSTGGSKKKPQPMAAPSSTPQKKSKQERAQARQKRAASAAERDAATFGPGAPQTESGSVGMTSEEKQALFTAYVVETDKRRAELGIDDDFWAVPVITAKDVVPAPRKKEVPRVSHVDLESTEVGPSAEGRNRRTDYECASDPEAFVFDRESVLACLL